MFSCVSFFPVAVVFPVRANIKSVFGQSLVFALAQGSIFYIYAAGYYLGAFLVISDESEPYHTSYDEVFR